jgi:hypothetical protein
MKKMTKQTVLEWTTRTGHKCINEIGSYCQDLKIKSIDNIDDTATKYDGVRQ